MGDIFDEKTRSEIMRRVKSKGNDSTEIRLARLFKKYGINGWRRSYPVKGRPDFVFLKERVAIFVDGCFWHGHDCRNTLPKDNSDYWKEKHNKNRQRDDEVTAMLQARGWKVLRIWECELKVKNQLDTLKRIALGLNRSLSINSPNTL